MIRHGYGLWGGNAALMMSCAEASGSKFMHPDSGSGVSIEVVWQRLQDDSAR
jgi:hypothetical protein